MAGQGKAGKITVGRRKDGSGGRLRQARWRSSKVSEGMICCGMRFGGEGWAV